MTPAVLDTYTFLNDPSVFRLYAYVRELSPTNLRAALSLRQLSSLGDEKVLREKLLYSLVLAHCPHARVPWSVTPEGIDGNEAARMWRLAEGIHDLFRVRQVVDQKSTLTRETQTDVASLVADKSKNPVEPAKSEKSIFETRLKYLSSLKHWGLSFTGETGQPAKDFLENLKDYRRFSRVNDHLLFDMLPCILDSKTRSWFRAKNFTSWEVFEPSFLNALVLLRDDDYSASSRLVSVAVGDSDSASVNLSAVDCDNSLYKSEDDAHEQAPARRSPDLYINLRPYRSSSYCLAALKQKSTRYASSQISKREIDDDDCESIVSESVSSASSVYERATTLNCYHACPGHHYAQPNCGHSSANAYAYSRYDQVHGYASSGHAQYDALGANSAYCAQYASDAAHDVAYSSEPYGLYYQNYY